MLKRFLMPGLVVLLFFTQAAAQIDSPKLTPVPSTDKQNLLIRQGVELHDRGDYDGAIRKYQEVLTENPDNVTALYEMSFSYTMKRDFKKSLELSYKGAQYKSEALVLFYQNIGNNLDQLGEPKKAIEVYKKAVKMFPQMALLHYNLGVTYASLDMSEDARKTLKTSASLNPKHPGTQLLLASQFFKNGYRTPALFAAARFLVLEPKSARSDIGVRIMQEVLRGGVTAGDKPNEINIFVDMNAKKDEGDFGYLDFSFGLSRAFGSTEKNIGKTEIQLLVEQVDSLLAILSERAPKNDQSKFVYQYYVPYFVELKQKGLVEPFVYYTLQRSNVPGVKEWLADHNGRVLQFLSWSNHYQWPGAAQK